jgi:hypothetical protein
MKKGRSPGAKDKSHRSRSPNGSHKNHTKLHHEIKARHATYPPAGALHMNQGMPPQGGMQIPNAMASAGGMPQGEEMSNVQGGGVV